jgi:hypothetical protein
MNNLFSNKKGNTAEDTMHVILLFFALSITALLFILLISAEASDKHVIPEGVEEKILIQRLLSSPSCFTYRDNVNRVYPGIIDLSRFNENVLQDCFNNLENAFAFGIDLKVDFGDRTERIQLNTTNWVKYEVSDYSPIINVLVKDSEQYEYRKGELQIKVQRKR